METYYVCNGNLVKQDPNSFIIEDSYESYENNTNQDESLELVTDVLQESRKRNCREWSQYETKILMDMYRRNVYQVGPTKKFKSKREMFECIAQTLSTRLNITRSAHQCENRYKTVVNQRKAGKTIFRKTRPNVGKIMNENERSQSDVSASVSADHDYNRQGSESPCGMKSINEWGDDDTKLLMELYKKNISKVGLERTFRTKVKMFEYIANTISSILNITRTAEQCLNRYKTIFRRKNCRKNKSNDNDFSMNNTIIESNINGNNNRNCGIHFISNLHESKLNTQIYDGNTPKKVIRQPKFLSNISSKAPDSSQDTLLTKTLKEIAIQKEKTLFKIAADREQAEERRHQETMALIQQLGQTIIQCIGNQLSDTSKLVNNTNSNSTS